MYRPKLQSRILPRERNSALLMLLAVIAVTLLIGTTALLVFIDDSANPFKQMYLMPWVFLCGAVFAAPSVYLIATKKFTLYHPLVFAAWSYFIPAFFLGGLFLAADLVQPYFLAFVEDEHYNLPLTFFYIALGYAGLSVGFFLPFGRNVGERISRRLPVWNWTARQVLLPALVVLMLGFANTFVAFALGKFGFQTGSEVEVFDGLIVLLTMFWLEANIILWLCVFRLESVNFNHIVLIGFLLVSSLFKSAVQGNRGSLLSLFITITAAFVLSGRQIKFKQGVVGGSLLVSAILIGMIYGTTFRSVKQTEDKTSIEQYGVFILDTFERVFEENPAETLEVAFESLTERIEGVSSVAVVVANYEKLAPYEESYGLDNNIWKEFSTVLIPRILWNEKPTASSPRKFADLYFNFSESSFTITPMGDLLRNFGPVGIPLGMIFLGVVIRFFYAALIENQPFAYWRATLYLMLLTGISYEGFYSWIIPYMFRITFISMVGILIIKFLVRQNSFTAANGLKRLN